MQTATLTLETLHNLSPDLTEDFRQQIARAVSDCKQRPSSNAKREVILKLSIYPHPDDADDVLIVPVTTGKTPARKLESVRCRRSRNDQLQFDFEGDA